MNRDRNGNIKRKPGKGGISHWLPLLKVWVSIKAMPNLFHFPRKLQSKNPVLTPNRMKYKRQSR